MGAVSAGGGREIVVDPFCLRQFTADTSYAGARIGMPPEEFEAQINDIFSSGSAPLVDGYAPFCKHLFVPNFAQVRRTMVPITPENEGLLRSGYEARTEKELAVLSRWFPATSLGDTGPAEYLDIILYSREQIRKENAAMGENSGSDAPWGIVSIKPQDVDYELPMQPITVMRNALGEEHGGSGVPIEHKAYRESVEFWSKYAPVK